MRRLPGGAKRCFRHRFMAPTETADSIWQAIQKKAALYFLFENKVMSRHGFRDDQAG